MAHILELHQAVGRVLDDDFVELVRVREPAHDAHRDLESLLRVGWRLPELAGGNLDVLLLERVHHVGCGQAAGGQAHGIEPHAHGVLALAEDHYIAHAGHALERVLHVDVQVVGDVFARVAAVARKEAGAEDEVVSWLSGC